MVCSITTPAACKPPLPPVRPCPVWGLRSRRSARRCRTWQISTTRPWPAPRVELGARHTLDGRAKLKVDGIGSDTVDLKDRTNPYAEVSLLMNQNGDLPVMAGLYYTRTEYKLDEDSEVADNTKLKRDEYGFKVGLAF